VVTGARRVETGDVGPTGAVRLDAVARYLQDVAAADAADAEYAAGPWWLVRRTAVRAVPGPDAWPVLGDDLAIATWAAGAGRAWAERRTDIDGPRGRIEASALWVHVGADGRPARLTEGFAAVYGEATEGRTASPRLPPTPGDHGDERPWPLRYADLDPAGHVNNAAVWEAVAEVVGDRLVTSAWIAHHGPLAAGDDVRLRSHEDDGELRVALLVGRQIRVWAAASVAR
jgi:acyl-ACP thioesterase